MPLQPGRLASGAAAAFIGVSVQALGAMVRRGQIAAYRTGTSRRARYTYDLSTLARVRSERARPSRPGGRSLFEKLAGVNPRRVSA
jgi:hypothetical protein